MFYVHQRWDGLSARRTQSHRSLFAAIQIGTPIVSLGMTLLGQQLLFPHSTPVWIASMFALGIG